MKKKFKICPHGEIYKDCPICKDNVKEQRIEVILEEGIGSE